MDGTRSVPTTFKSVRNRSSPLQKSRMSYVDIAFIKIAPLLVWLKTVPTAEFMANTV